MSESTAARVEARLNALKAENAKFRGFVECVASQSLDTADGSWILKDLVEEALAILAPPLVSCRKCGDDLKYDPNMEPIVTENGRNRVMCVPCIYHML
jgi:hypothetical protein